MRPHRVPRLLAGGGIEVAMLDPLAHVSGHVAQAVIGVAARRRADGARRHHAAFLPVVGGLVAGRFGVAPRVQALLAGAARGVFPLRLRRQTAADPAGELLGLEPVDAHDGTGVIDQLQLRIGGRAARVFRGAGLARTQAWYCLKVTSVWPSQTTAW